MKIWWVYRVLYLFCVYLLFQVDEKALKHITEMGFSKEAARQALMDNSNSLEAALNFLLNNSKQKPIQGPPPRGKACKEVL